MILVYITNPSKEVAQNIAKHLLGKKLIACANIFGPVISIYPWEGEIYEDAEYVLICKTIEDNFGKIKEEVENIHPYSTPCIIKISAEANEKYLKWLKGEIEQRSV